jgi:hypothetical protein
MGRLAHYPAIPLIRSKPMTDKSPKLDITISLEDLHRIRHALRSYAVTFAQCAMPNESDDCLCTKARIEDAIEAWIKGE